ncbi:MAG: hypothetical protein HUJ84_06650, partial [Veillonella sp.]|nr:hypothetical protein [Veillonella sp.]
MGKLHIVLGERRRAAVLAMTAVFALTGSYSHLVKAESIVMGSGTQHGGDSDNDIAIGINASATGSNAIAFGTTTVASN